MTTLSKQLHRLIDRLEQCRHTGQTVCLFPHAHLDGDALGSCLALLLAFKQLGLCVLLPLDEPVPGRLDFLPELDRITPLGPTQPDFVLKPDSIALLVDGSDCQRTGEREKLCRSFNEHWVIDHHVLQRQAGPRDVIDVSAAAVAEIVYDLICLLEKRYKQNLFNKEIKEALLVALISDTGGFVFSNTTKRSFQVASALMSDAIDLEKITYRLFRQNSRARLKLMGDVFSQARFHFNNTVITARISQRQMELYQATNDDLDGIINALRDVNGIAAAFLFRQQPDGTIRVNIRSSESLDASYLAASFGGGGHKRAAGMTLTDLTLPQAEEIVLQKAGDELAL